MRALYAHSEGVYRCLEVLAGHSVSVVNCEVPYAHDDVTSQSGANATPLTLAPGIVHLLLPLFSTTVRLSSRSRLGSWQLQLLSVLALLRRRRRVAQATRASARRSTVPRRSSTAAPDACQVARARRTQSRDAPHFLRLRLVVCLSPSHVVIISRTNRRILGWDLRSRTTARTTQMLRWSSQARFLA